MEQKTPWCVSWRCLGLPGEGGLLGDVPGLAGWSIWLVPSTQKTKELDKTDKDSCPLASWPTGHPAPDYVPNCDEVNVCGTGVTGGMFLRITQNGGLCCSLASASAVLEQMRTMKGSTPGCTRDVLQRCGTGGIFEVCVIRHSSLLDLSKCSR